MLFFVSEVMIIQSMPVILTIQDFLSVKAINQFVIGTMAALPMLNPGPWMASIDLPV